MHTSSAPTAMHRAQRGAIAIMTVILLPVLAAFAALAVDVGRMYVYRSEIQNAMDACALAAVAPLTGANNPAIFDQARAYGKALSDPGLNGAATRTSTTVNRLHFQSDNFVSGDIVVEFSSALSGAPWIEATSASYAGITPVTARFVRCTYRDEDNPLLLLPLLRVLVPSAIDRMTVAASAAASLTISQSACIFPVAVCASSSNPAVANPGNFYGNTPGARLTSIGNSPPAYGTGNFGWLDLNGMGAAGTRALITGAGSCGGVEVGDTVGHPGNMATLESAWNTRFGLYRTFTAATAPPDFTGFSYPTGNNNYANYVTRLAARTPFQGTVHTNYNVTTNATHIALGSQRRIAVAAIVDCGVWAGAGNPPILDFACILLLAPKRDTGPVGNWSQVSESMDVEFLGLTSTAGSPCASTGLSGGGYGPKVPTLVQ